MATPLPVPFVTPMYVTPSTMAPVWFRWFDQVAIALTIGYAPQGGTTATRPGSPSLYQTFFDSTLGIPIWVKSLAPVVWVNAAGVTV